MKIKMSKSNWLQIGSEAGWIKEGAVEAPTKTPVKSPTTTPSPQKAPSRGPFNPPKPKILPKPKARKDPLEKQEDKDGEKNLYSELKKILQKKAAKPYEKGAHPSVQDFWKNIPEKHPYKQHPLLSGYGHNLSSEGYDYIGKKTDVPGKESPIDVREMFYETTSLLKKIMSIEADKKEELIEAAKDITSEIWGIDKTLLEGFLGTKEESQDEGAEQKPRSKVAITPALRNEINKRITMNVLTHGSALHAMNSVHYLIKEKLNAISPELINLYTRFSGLVTQHFYVLDIPAILKAVQSHLGQASIGWSHVEYRGEEPVVVADGWIFPSLVQEFFKGVMELISLNGIPQDLSEEELQVVYDNADRLEDEPWIAHVGPALWRRFLEIVPKDVNLSDVIMYFSKLPAEKSNKLIVTLIKNPEMAKNYLHKISRPTEEPMQYEDTKEYPEPEDLV